MLKTQTPCMKLVRAKESETKLVFKDIGTLMIYLHTVLSMVGGFSVQQYEELKVIKLADK
jgi:hypothetical protein